MRTYKLTRTAKLPDGIFGRLIGDRDFQCVTLEHAYFYDLAKDGTYEPKVPPGVYTCVRGLHRLHSMTQDFETFEITGVEGHSNILFHPGNTEKDSEGCVLLGTTRQGVSVVESKIAFTKFMESLSEEENFILEVSDAVLS